MVAGRGLGSSPHGTLHSVTWHLAFFRGGERETGKEREGRREREGEGKGERGHKREASVSL